MTTAQLDSLSAAGTQAQAQAQAQWTIDANHSMAGFAVRHMMISTVRGRFAGVSGTFEFDEARPEAARVEATIPAATIDTGVPARDEHLRSPDFFEASRFPNLTFRSTGVESLGAARYRVRGDLTIRDVTRPVILEAKVSGSVSLPDGTTLIGFTAETSIDRRDFGLTWNQALETGGVLVGHEVAITLEIEASRDAVA